LLPVLLGLFRPLLVCFLERLADERRFSDPLLISITKELRKMNSLLHESCTFQGLPAEAVEHPPTLLDRSALHAGTVLGEGVEAFFVEEEDAGAEGEEHDGEAGGKGSSERLKVETSKC
jgi:hypothetical protein